MIISFRLLDNNPLVILPAGSFDSLTNLTTLGLSSVAIQVLDPGLFVFNSRMRQLCVFRFFGFCCTTSSQSSCWAADGLVLIT